MVRRAPSAPQNEKTAFAHNQRGRAARPRHGSVTVTARRLQGVTMLAPVRVLTSAAGLVLAAGGLLVPAPLAAAAATPACTDADLTASYRHSDAGMGHSYGWIVLRNTSDHPCRTGGFGGVSYVGNGDGTQIGHPAVRRDRSAVRSFVIESGERLRSPLDEVTAQNYPHRTCRPKHVDGFRVYVPNATRSQYVVHPTVGCRNGHVHLLFQKPYRRP
jgi:hypothetical protein